MLNGADLQGCAVCGEPAASPLAEACSHCGAPVGSIPMQRPEVPAEVAVEVAVVADPSPGNKTQDHFRSRRKLFEQVDRLIRGRVREVLPAITLEFKRELDQSLGLDAMRKRVERVSDGVAADLKSIDQQMQMMLNERLEALLNKAMADCSALVQRQFEERITDLVAEECGRQIGALLQFAGKLDRQGGRAEEARQEEGEAFRAP